MNIIKILHPQEAQKIAAGEIIERPAHIVKELIENSIDAGATQISCYIEGAGKKLIRIVDNGCGMAEDDARLCFARHATSKISCLDDLASLISFGFRGEALASIAAVSNVLMSTKRADRELGYRLSYKAGALHSQEEIACQQGTDLSVADLFENMPARKKFLKQDDTEWHQITAAFHAFCLSHLAIHFQLYQDNKLVLNAPAVSSVKDRVGQVWDVNTAHNLMELEQVPRNNLSWCSLTGAISQHHFWRYSKAMFFFFVNNRWVKDLELSKAVMKGYQHVLPPGKFPAVFMSLSVDPAMVDINVHPKKEEVRFAKSTQVSNLIQHMISATLEHAVNKRLTISSVGRTTVACQPHKKDEDFVPSVVLSGPTPLQGRYTEPVPAQHNNVQHHVMQRTAETTVPLLHHAQAPIVQRSDTGKIIGQLFNTYLIIEHENSCVIIDQHAAHERILYEQFKKKFARRDGTILLFPIIVKLIHPGALAQLLTEQAFFLQHGISFEQFGPRELAITSCSPDLASNDLQELIKECADLLQEGENFDTESMRTKLHEHVHSHLACKTAVKAGDQLSSEKMAYLIKSLSETENKNICIHGRPTTWTLEKTEIEKRFRRK